MRGAPVDSEALLVGLTMVPGLISRNRSFWLFESADARRARARAGQLRGIVRQLTGAQGGIDALAVAVSPRGKAREMRYRVPGLRMERRALLDELEYACVAYLAGRAGVPGLSVTEEDRARIDAALRRLASTLRLDARLPPEP
jgi:hypothetical protein